MTFNQLTNIWTPYEILNVVIWLCLLILIMYLAKNPAHKTIRALCLVISEGLSHMADSFLSAEEKVKERNREVLFTSGLESMEKNIELEFNRINTVVERDLGGFPVLKRQLQEQIERIEEDYQQASEIPPAPPGWVEAVEALSKLPDEANENKAVTNILKEIHKTTCDQYKTAKDDYKKAVSAHHTILNNLMPTWRRLTNTLTDVAKVIGGIRERAVKIDNHMADYEAIRAQTNHAERMLSSSATIQFFISSLFLAISIFGIIVNFNLIALPMTEMVGGNSYIGSMKTSDVVALVVILLEVSLGIYLMESMRLTDMFPGIRSMDDKMRIRMAWITFGFLLVLACVESSLALMRERIALNEQAMIQTLAGTDILQPTSTMIPTVGQMIMGFSLPFVLMLTAFPLESFIHSSRTVLGACTAFAMRFCAFLFTLMGKFISNCGELLINLYDLVVFPLIWFEETVVAQFRKEKQPAEPQTREETAPPVSRNTSNDSPAEDTEDTESQEGALMPQAGEVAS